MRFIKARKVRPADATKVRIQWSVGDQLLLARDLPCSFLWKKTSWKAFLWRTHEKVDSSSQVKKYHEARWKPRSSPKERWIKPWTGSTPKHPTTSKRISPSVTLPAATTAATANPPGAPVDYPSSAWYNLSGSWPRLGRGIWRPFTTGISPVRFKKMNGGLVTLGVCCVGAYVVPFHLSTTCI
jgi:hypothetical protein